MWRVAVLVRDTFKRGKDLVRHPVALKVVFRRPECVLARTKPMVSSHYTPDLPCPLTEPAMPLRKSHLYSSLWQSCDQLRGGMDASQYKDYILTLLFMKYVSDKYSGDDDFADITVPPGGSFTDMLALKGTKEIGDGINKVIGRLADANGYLLKGVIDQADFNDESEARQGKGDAAASLGARRDLRGARFSRQSRPWRRPPGRRVRIPHAALRDPVGQEQGTVLHSGGSLPHHGPGDRGSAPTPGGTTRCTIRPAVPGRSSSRPPTRRRTG